MAGIDDLKREAKGFEWYLQNRVKKFHFKKYIIPHRLFEIKIEKFLAVEPVCKPLNRRNFTFYLKAIDEYKKIWGFNACSSDKYPVHGDFSLDGNILFSKSEIFIIDWEHFHESAAPLGFDILYLIYEAVKISAQNRLPKMSTVNLAIELVQYASEQGVLSDQFRNNSLTHFLICQNKIKGIWSNQVDKIPTFNFTKEQLRFLTPLFNF